MEQPGIFSRKFEIVYRYLLGIFLLLAVLNWFGVIPAGVTKLRSVQFLMTIVLLDGVHVIFTVVTLVGLPEFRKWFVGLLRSSRVWVFSLVMVTLAFNAYLRVGSMAWPALVFTAGLTFVLARVHTLAQLKGLSLLFNKVGRSQLTAAEILRHRQVESIERVLFNAFIAIILLDRLLVHLFDLHAAIKIPFLCVSVSLSLLLIANAFRYPKAGRNDKRFFLSNCFMVSTAVYFPFVNLLQKSLHGFEYIFLSIDMSRRSSAVKSKAWVGQAALIVGAHLLILLFSFHYISQKKWLPSELIVPVLFAHSFFDFFHYYIDSLIFRFRDADVRQLLGPVILPSEDPAMSTVEEKLAA